MLVTAVCCLLLGAVLGLKFNLKIIGHAIVVATICCMTAALLGKLSIGEAFLYGLIAAVALQIGYFVSLLIAALGLADSRDIVSAEHPVAKPSFEVPGEFRKNT